MAEVADGPHPPEARPLTTAVIGRFGEARGVVVFLSSGVSGVGGRGGGVRVAGDPWAGRSQFLPGDAERGIPRDWRDAGESC